MNKEKLLELFSVAVDRKASIRIHFSQFHRESGFKDVTNEEAYALASSFKEALNATEISHDFGGSGTQHYEVDQGDIGVCISYIPGAEEQTQAKLRRIEALEKELAQLKEEEAM